MAGGHGQGGALNQLHYPFGFDIGDDGSLFIADKDNHRIIRWRPNATQGEIVVGDKEQGSRTDQLNQPVAVVIDRINRSLIIGDHGNRRIIRWFLNEQKHNDDEGEVIISDIISAALAIDDEGSLYVSDWEKNQVCRYGRGGRREGVTVAGGNDQGAGLNQLDRPRHLFVDADYCIYVSDTGNHRVMKWVKGAKEGVVVAGGQGEGNRLEQLRRPSGIFVDQMGSVYVADQESHRLMRWLKDAKKGEVIVGESGEGSQNNQLNRPASISLDDRGNLYVVDRNNNRISCFEEGIHQHTGLFGWWNPWPN